MVMQKKRLSFYIKMAYLLICVSHDVVITGRYAFSGRSAEKMLLVRTIMVVL